MHNNTCSEKTKWLGPEATQAAFLIGGIGTGSFSLGNRGELKDWEIFNSPGKGNHIPLTFFSIWAKEQGQEPVSLVLEGQLQPPFSGSNGFNEDKGLARFRQFRMSGEYPFAKVQLSDPSIPLEVELVAYNPFIPLNADDSGIPGGVLHYKVKNTCNKPVDFSICGCLGKFTLTEGASFQGGYHDKTAAVSIEYREYETADTGRNLKGLYFENIQAPKASLEYGSMSLATGAENVSCKTKWLDGGWFDGLQDFWNDFAEDGKLERESRYTELDVVNTGNGSVGSLAAYSTLGSGDETDITFYITWNFPNRINAWNRDIYSRKTDGRLPEPVTQNYYAAKHANAWETARYLFENSDRLYKYSRLFRQALYSSTLPECVIDAVASTITVIRSNTCFRLENGDFMAWEGCFNGDGSCEGNCTHVWNYGQTLAFLFPELERSMRRLEFELETESDGKMNFRGYRRFGLEPNNEPPAADGQLGTIIRLYRDWKLSDDEFLKDLWPKAKRALDFAFDYWDRDGDFVLDANQHNTYDIEFVGPNSLTCSMFYAALAAGAKMSEAVGDIDSAAKYRSALEKGSKNMDELLWNGEYYVQKPDSVNLYRYQYGDGCLSDQLLGQMLAHLCGLGYILPKKNVKKAVYSIYKYNFKHSFNYHHNPQRTYALNDEKGLVLCSWPKGGRPRIPFPYSDEVWSGIEYQVASHLIYEGYVDEGIQIVESVRKRHDGVKRSPWNEVECGHHYARSTASYSLLCALSGLKFDMPSGKIDFEPAINKEDFRCFYCCGNQWGILTQNIGPQGQYEKVITILYRPDIM